MYTQQVKLLGSTTRDDVNGCNNCWSASGMSIK